MVVFPREKRVENPKRQQGGYLKPAISTKIIKWMMTALLLPAVLLAAVRSGRQSANSEPANVSMVALLASAEKYNGVRVRTYGFLAIEFEGNALYLHQEDYIRGLGKNALELNFSQAQEKQFKSLHRKYVIIEGTVSADRALIDRSTSSGALGQITRIEYWQPRGDSPTQTR